MTDTPAVASTDVTATEEQAGSEDTDTAGVASTSVCGLTGEVTVQARLAKAPDVDYWDYQGTTAYPVSEQYGPGATADTGYRYCFQHSPEGAVFAAANAVAHGDASDSDIVSWMTYFLAEGHSREELLSQDVDDNSGGTGSTQGTRTQVSGFKLLSYDGQNAKVDVAVTGSVNGQVVYLSMVYELVWEDGDWKLVVDDPVAPINVATIPSVAGYIAMAA
ncbi:hypothetical protein [Actinomyces sp. Z5]|uniref:hypothetical protein n=1 Tax=Actinomyces sp. Z5 TaxID=2250216 RepID=UPI0011BF9860|nr:hypothetical protein [Actinomyces sp. Z5]